jgi:phytoene dehydrogenase-like protein
VLHPAGGLSGLAGRLLALATRRGAALRAAEPVDGVDVRTGRVRAVRLAGGERLPVDAVVAAVDPAVVARWLPGSRLAGRLARLRPTLAARVAWWVVEGVAPGAVPHALHFPEGERLEPLYVTVPTAIEPALAPPGTSVVYALVHGPAGERATAALADALRLRVAAAGQWPGGRVLAAGVEGGGEPCYGYAMRPGLLGSLRLSQRAAGLANLWLAGGAVFPGPGVANVLRSGLRAAALADGALAGGPR